SYTALTHMPNALPPPHASPPCLLKPRSVPPDLHSFPTRRSSDLLLDEVEEKLDIKLRPLSWPISMGKTFKGVYNLYNKSLNLFTDRKSTRLNSSHVKISYAVFCLKKKITSDTSHMHQPPSRPPTT